jgi:HAD superfamily hydrolase (TIGR01509 family)
MMLGALIWDLDGTLAETERDGHLVAFNEAFAARGLPWHWSDERYGELLHVTGGLERLLHDMASRPDAPAGAPEREALARELHAEKNRRYAAIVERGGISLRPGVLRLLREAIQHGVLLGLATTTSRVNADALLSTQLGAQWGELFAAVVCGEDAPRRKPDPQVYLRCLELLRLDPEDAIAIEDSANGLAAAGAAGIATLVTRSVFFARSSYEGALAVCDDLEHPAAPSPRLPDARPAHVDLARLREWHAAWWQESMVA